VGLKPTGSERVRADWTWWAMLAGVALAGGVVAIVADVPVALQAIALAVFLAGSAVVLHRRGPSPPPAEIERPRPDTEVAVERRAVELIASRPLARRTMLGMGAVGVLGGASVLRWLGPRPARSTVWEAGRRLVTTEGSLLRPDEIALGGVVTAWPEGHIDAELAAVMVIRLREPPRPPTRREHVVDGTLVAYSRICTHAGCPVALFRDLDQALFCPCHQATFDATAGAVPTFGPASRPLPQLPLGVDDEGVLIALADFPTLPGPRGGGP
jgi:ubiquinol-cytochrome c reductase iron-sulfur subunit